MPKLKHLNDPKISRKFNYVYRIHNKINGKIYIGVHRTDNLNDGYMGSGKILKRSIKKHGRENFEKEILYFFETYQEALDMERHIVDVMFIERSDTYNIKEGGYGNCSWSTEMLQQLSESAIEKWKDPVYRKMMREKCYDNVERNNKISKASKEWIKNNPSKHKARMVKINKNPDKINKMAETHRGMVRSEGAKRNISEGQMEAMRKNPEMKKRRSGEGMIYIHNPTLNERKRICKTDIIPDGWFRGLGKRK